MWVLIPLPVLFNSYVGLSSSFILYFLLWCLIFLGFVAFPPFFSMNPAGQVEDGKTFAEGYYIIVQWNFLKRIFRTSFVVNQRKWFFNVCMTKPTVGKLWKFSTFHNMFCNTTRFFNVSRIITRINTNTYTRNTNTLLHDHDHQTYTSCAHKITQPHHCTDVTIHNQVLLMTYAFQW